MSVTKSIIANKNVMKARSGQTSWTLARGSSISTATSTNQGTVSGYEYLQIKSTKTTS